jgi:uncharacterized protein (TIGR00297 family)
MTSWQMLSLGLVLALAISWLAHRLGALDRSGLWAATLVGGIVFGLGGWQWGMLLVGFFVSSSLLSHLRSGEKQIIHREFARGEARDWRQVLANGGWPALLSLASAYGQSPLLDYAFLGALAAVTADTWATELGILSSSPPRLISSGRKVPTGTSGAISPLGLGASLAGAASIGLLAVGLSGAECLWRGQMPSLLPLRLVGTACAGGMVGTMMDSLLGATLQGKWRCEKCQRETERRVHSCGEWTYHLRGIPWLDNDGVNTISSLAGSLASAGMALLVS